MLNLALRKRKSAAVGLFIALMSGSAMLCAATDVMPNKAGMRVASKALVNATNGILTVEIENTTGQFTIRTGASHPNPGQTVFYPVGSSNITLRDATHQTMFVNSCASGLPGAGLGGYGVTNMCTTPPAVSALGTTGFRTTYTVNAPTGAPYWTVQQDVVINGTTLANTNVSQTVTVTNTNTILQMYGLRYHWDWEIAGNDGSFFRQRNPDGAFTGVPTAFPNPGFQLYEEVNNIATPLFSVFGTVGNGLALTPPPTKPDVLRYSNWPSSWGSAWDYTDPGSTTDSSTVYFWGYTTPLTLAAGASASFTQYVTTQISAVGGSTPIVTVPTLTQWGMLLLAGLVIALGGVSMYRRRRS